MPDSPPLLSIHALHKSFAAPVLRGFDLTLQHGEVHALIGGNGAGKSTLANILAGLLPPDQGKVLLNGQPHTPATRLQAQCNGVVLMLQELHLLPTLSIAENLFLHQLPATLGFIHKKTLLQKTTTLLQQVGLGSLDPNTPTSALGIGQQQLVVLAGALMHDCQIIILDEPTAALTASETNILFQHIRNLRAQGKSIIYISHRMDELREIADTVSILRDGQRIATMPITQTSTSELVRLMAGKELSIAQQHQPNNTPTPVALRVTNLHAGPRVNNVSFDAHAGEIFGLSGLVGAGRTETLRAIFGANPIHSGHIEIGHPLQPVSIKKPSDAVKAGIGLVPEDRKQDGLLLPLGMTANTTLASLHGFRLQQQQQTRTTQHLQQQLDVRCNDLDQPTITLSGGNQQKIVLARWLLRDVNILLLDEPTRGVDATSKAAIYQQLRNLAHQGKTLVVVSSEAPELLALCDRIAVMSAGQLVETRAAADWTLHDLTHAAFQGHLSHP